jgi:hypothetical protein
MSDNHSMNNHAASAAETQKTYRSPLVRCLWLGIGFLIGFGFRWQRTGEIESSLLHIAIVLVLLGIVGVGITFFKRIEQEETESTE